jgi:hypothetical protein
VFKKGHRIRLSVSGSDFPHFIPILRPSDNSLVIDSAHPAGIEFDVVNSNGEGTDWKWIGSKKRYLAGKSDTWNTNQAANNYLMGITEPPDPTPTPPCTGDDCDGPKPNPPVTPEETPSEDDSSDSTFCFIDTANI